MGSRTVNRLGWLLTISTILTALSIVPIFTEGQSWEWLEWFGAPAGLILMLLRPKSETGVLTAGAVALVANMVILALGLELLFRGANWVKRRRVAEA